MAEGIGTLSELNCRDKMVEINPEIASLLAGRINKPDIDYIVTWMEGAQERRDAMLQLAVAGDGRINANALWCLTHLRRKHPDWLQSKRGLFIDRLLNTESVSVKRMLLQMLREQTFDPDTIRVDLLDFCLSKINSESEPYAIRAFSLYVSFNMCRFYPDLIAELEERISLLGHQSMSPGMKCAVRNVSRAIRTIKPSETQF